MISEKKRCRIRDFVTIFGEALPDFDLGYETWGELAPNKDNVILVCHYFSGSSHAAGKYSDNDALPGFWDSIIGSGKVLDTDRFFVICCDSIVNQNRDAIGLKPSSINPATGEAYGQNLPNLTMRDFVNAQAQVLAQLGITNLYAVAGPSMGSMQALTWAAAYPERVGRVIAVISAGLSADAYLIERTEQWTAPIHLAGEAGLPWAVRQILLDAMHPDYLQPLYGREKKQDRWLVHYVLEKHAAWVAQNADAAAILALVKANQNYDLLDDPRQGDARKITAPILFVLAEHDLLLFPERAEAAANWLRTQGKHVAVTYLTGAQGHLEGVNGILEAADVMREFLEF